jgi:hypothetical protein
MQTINLNLIPGSVLPVVNVSQYDEGRQFAIAVYDGAAAYSLTSKTVQIQGLKADGHGFMYGQSDTVHGTAVLSVSTNVVTVTTPKQMTAAEGNARVELRIKDSSDNVVHTLNFILCVEPSALPDNAEMSASEYSYVQHLIDVAEGISTNVPYIGANGNWWIWDAVTEQYVDSGVDASITVQIADVTMLDPSDTPYVTNTGTDTDPIFHLFIPRGKGISSIAKTSTSGLVDTYTITFSDSTTTTFTVTNGRGVPDGGLTGQVLAKKTNADGDCEWVTGGGGGSGALYGTCSTGRNTAAKEATVSGFTSLAVGATVALRFTDTGASIPSSGGITLNINSTGAMPVVDGHSDNVALTYLDDYFHDNLVQEFMYDGTSWVWINGSREDFTWENNAVFGVHNIMPKVSLATYHSETVTMNGNYSFSVDCTSEAGSGATITSTSLSSWASLAGILGKPIRVFGRIKASAAVTATIGTQTMPLTTEWQDFSEVLEYSSGYPGFDFTVQSGGPATISVGSLCISWADDPVEGFTTYAKNNIQLTSEIENDALYVGPLGCTATTGDFVSVNDSRITSSHVVANVEFSKPSAITTDVTWTTATGILTLNGTCTDATCNAYITLVKVS